jgi:hypothetical protein
MIDTNISPDHQYTRGHTSEASYMNIVNTAKTPKKITAEVTLRYFMMNGLE